VSGAPRALALGLLLAAVVSCGTRPPPTVVFFAVDTLRADHLGCYGYPRPTSPRMDALARESVLFEHAISQSPWTLPAFASMLTGVVPSRHGAGRGKRCLFGGCGALFPERGTLGERFVAAGYRTAAFVSNGFAGPAVGLGRGFETAEVVFGGRATVDRAIGWLEQHHTAPAFLFVVIIEPHAPYTPPREDAAPFIDPAYAGPIGMKFDGVVDPGWTEADRRRVVDLYDGEVHTADRLVGRLLDALARIGIDEEALVVVAADHGEELFDHGSVGHGHTMYDELLRVPLLVRFPGGTPRGRIDRQVRTMDVFPTILDAMGIPIPSGLDGVSLLGLARGGAAPPETDVAPADFTYRPPDLRAVRRADRKLIVDVDQDAVSLFDLVRDPLERLDIARAQPAEVASLRRTLTRTHNADDVTEIHVIVRGGTTARRVHLQLVTSGPPFAGVTLEGAEPDDRVATSADRRMIVADLAVEAAGEDRVRIARAPESRAPTMLTSLTVDDRPLDSRSLLLGSIRASATVRVPLVLNPTDLLVSDLGFPVDKQGEDVQVAVQAVLSSTHPTITFDAETAEHLRALGYAQ
jgi:arylsulfatase A-like enzyme